MSLNKEQLLAAEQLFSLLPAVYRTRDASEGGPLKALLSVLAAQSTLVKDNVEQLYDDQFIETCASWVIPYLGDLVGYNSIYELVSASFDSRAEVANTIGYRRRKGTLLALEQLSMDVSGRPAVVVEEFKRLITTESMRHVRPCHKATVNLRNVPALDRFLTPFDVENRTIDVRRIAPRVRIASDPDTAPLDIALHGPGRFNIPDVAIHLWRWRSLPVVNAPAVPVGGGRYFFSPLGQDMPLFSQPPARSSFERLMTRIDVPQPIRHHEFSISLGHSPIPTKDSLNFYGPSASILLVADGNVIPASQICCANLSDLPNGSWCKVSSGRVAIDPELGRIQFASDVPLPQSLRLNYCYGFPAEIGGGPYDRSASLSQLDPAKVQFLAVVGSVESPTIEAAIQQWNAQAPGSSGLVILPNFENYSIDLTGSNAIQIASESNLWIVAGQALPKGGPRDFLWSNARVALTGNVEVVGGPARSLPGGTSAPAGQLVLSGIWIAGQIVAKGQRAAIQLQDTTLVPGLGLTHSGAPLAPDEPSIVISAAEASLSLIRSISGPIAASGGGSTRICSSIVDATAPCCVAYAGADLNAVGADLHVEDTTIVGKVWARTLKLASNTIFHARRASHDQWKAAVWSLRKQTGCVRFCSLPFDSITPRRYRCIPPDAATQSALEPKFITLQYGHPSYALLSGDVPLAVWQGADNGSQMGVYYQIDETAAVRNVQLRAPEFLPFGLEAGIFLEPSRTVLLKHVPQFYGYSVIRKAIHPCDAEDDEGLDFEGFGARLI